MELLMKTKSNFFTYVFLMFIFLAVLLVLTGCSGRKNSREQFLQNERVSARFEVPSEDIDVSSLLKMLDELAELERAGSWFQGMALTESSIRETTGDFAGAVAAAYKELSRAYGLGLIKKEELEQGLLNVLNVNGYDSVIAAANAILAFIQGRWDEAAEGFLPLFGNLELEEPDGFGRWMLLVCILEKDRAVSKEETKYASAAYRSIRARYAQYPEYWYRGARVFSGVIAADFAENCINLSPQGPFADECRSILASHAGLRTEDGLSIKTMREIEAIISFSVNSGDPEFLNSLLPLISLPDNPYTVYAVGALRALTSVPRFRDYFNNQASIASGRLAERLSYICRG
jgi:hypothetical protein